MDGMAIGWRTRRVGRVSWAAFGAFSIGTLFALWGVYEVSGSPLLQWLLLLISATIWGALASRAAKTRPLPLTPQPEPPTKPWLVALIVGADIALLVGVASAGEGLGFQPGFWFWFFLCLAVPFLAVTNWFGTQRSPARTPIDR
jgi:hypothetical protein